MEEKSMYINHNGMATNVANTLTSHYSNLSTSTQRLSSGMRINSAADDAAGLAISELMRADIAALNQGVRNANDAISLIQTADGALGVIDEKLIRMKELAEQASTGTYDSTQRMMIDSEYQQMASEITRIANATDFNGVKLLDGSLSGVHDGSQTTATGAMKVHFGTSNDSAEDYYYIEIGEATAQAFGLGSASTWEDGKDRIAAKFSTELEKQIDKIFAEGGIVGLTDADKAAAKRLISTVTNDVAQELEKVSTGFTDAELLQLTQMWTGTTPINNNGIAFNDAGKDLATGSLDKIFEKLTEPTANAALDAAKVRENYDKLSDTEKEKLSFAFGMATLEKWDGATSAWAAAGGAAGTGVTTALNTTAGSQGFGNLAIIGNGGQAANEINTANVGGDATRVANLLNNARDAAINATFTEMSGKVNYAGKSIATQEDAQIALDAIQNAIVEKDKIRAHLGATQNRLENTVTNLTIQSENLQNAESRIRDADVATEMANFVRNQVLTQSAVAMLSQANSMPQMARQLIG